MTHLAETYEAQLTALTHVDIFKGILLRYEQNQELKGVAAPCDVCTSMAGGCICVPQQTSIGYYAGRRALSDEDEAYFCESDDDSLDEASSHLVEIRHGSTPSAMSALEAGSERPVNCEGDDSRAKRPRVEAKHGSVRPGAGVGQ